jgi:hypothetical protein
MTTTLRPLGLGELLDRSFFLYRKHFALFVGIAALPYLLLLVFQLTGVVLGTQRAGVFSALYWAWLLAIMVIQLGVTAASQGATVIAVSNVHLDREATISSAFAGIKGRIFSIALITIGAGLGIGLGFILLIIPGIILALMWALVIPIAVLEDTGLGDSISRSSALTKGSRLRILVIYILYFFLLYTFILLWEIPMFAAIGMFARGHNPAMIPLWSRIVIPICSFLSLSLVTPLITIALSLTYYDQRVRKEAFDLQHMMSILDGTTPGDTATALPG